MSTQQTGFSVDDKLKSLIGAKDVLVRIQFRSNDAQGTVIGLAQGVGVNIGQTVDRLIVLGTKATLPFAGYYMAQITFRKFYMHTQNPIPKTNMQDTDLPNPVQNAQITFYDPNKPDKVLLTMVVSKGFWNAHSISAQAGQVLVFEDFSLDCEDIQFQQPN